MGCDTVKEKIESEMLYLKLERVAVREERKKILDELEKLTGLKWKRYEIPDYLNINEKIKIENEILGLNRSYVNEEEYYKNLENKRKKRKNKKKIKNKEKKHEDNKKNISEEIKEEKEDSIENEKKIEENSISDIDVENELKKSLNKYNINEKNIQIKAIEIINKKYLNKINNNDDNNYEDLNYIMEANNKNKNIKINEESNEITEAGDIKNIELIKIKPLKKRNINNKEKTNKKTTSWIDNTNKSIKLFNFNNE